MMRIAIRKEIRGNILDLGGGGEGVIGRVYGPRVTAIDNRQDELYEAPKGPRKLLMDARTLSFADGTFDNATAFYFFMYLDEDARRSVMQETYRVLKPGGRFYIWDADMETADPFLVELCIDAGGTEIHTTYGIYKKDPVQDSGIIAAAAGCVGFQLIRQTAAEGQFTLCFEKPGGEDKI